MVANVTKKKKNWKLIKTRDGINKIFFSLYENVPVCTFTPPYVVRPILWKKRFLFVSPSWLSFHPLFAKYNGQKGGDKLKSNVERHWNK